MSVYLNRIPSSRQTVTNGDDSTHRTSSKYKSLSQPAKTEVIQNLTSSKSKSLSQPAKTEVIKNLTSSKSKSLGQSETPDSVEIIKNRTVSPTRPKSASPLYTQDSVEVIKNHTASPTRPKSSNSSYTQYNDKASRPKSKSLSLSPSPSQVSDDDVSVSDKEELNVDQKLSLNIEHSSKLIYNNICKIAAIKSFKLPCLNFTKIKHGDKLKYGFYSGEGGDTFNSNSITRRTFIDAMYNFINYHGDDQIAAVVEFDSNNNCKRVIGHTKYKGIKIFLIKYVVPAHHVLKQLDINLSDNKYAIINDSDRLNDYYEEHNKKVSEIL
jgi:hypothetical protein